MAAIPPVLSEGEDPLGKVWRACTYAAGMMAAYAVAGGAAVFPKGYTGKERNALEASDNQPDNSPEGASLGDLDVALKARYGMSLNKVSGSLSNALERKGTVLVVQGTYGRLPDVLRLSKTFTGGHAVTVIPQGNGKSLWLDPIAPSGSKGKIVDNNTILNFAWGPQFARVGKVADSTGSTATNQYQQDLLEWAKLRGFSASTILDASRMKDFYTWVFAKRNIKDRSPEAYALQGFTTLWHNNTIGGATSPDYDPTPAQDPLGGLGDLAFAPINNLTAALGDFTSGVTAIATYLIAVIIIVLGFYIYTKGGSRRPEVIVAPQ